MKSTPSDINNTELINFAAISWPRFSFFLISAMKESDSFPIHFRPTCYEKRPLLLRNHWMLLGMESWIRLHVWNGSSIIVARWSCHNGNRFMHGVYTWEPSSSRQSRNRAECDTMRIPLGRSGAFVPPLQADIPNLECRIAEAMREFPTDCIAEVWRELQWLMDVCCMTAWGSHLELVCHCRPVCVPWKV
jgi:hypothetical protein